MIRGKLRTYDFRFGDDFSDFLQSVDKASVTYKVDPVEVDGKLNELPDIRFNLQPSVDKYISSLVKEFSNSCDDIEKLVDEAYAKTEKLNLLSRFIVEVEASQRLLTHSETSGYSHKRFTFSNVSKDEKYQGAKMDTKDFQDHFFWMDHYLKKMLSYLQQLRHTIEITPQNEFQLPVTMQPDANAPTAKKPFAFYEYLYLRNGIAQLRRAFIPSEDDYHYLPYIHYDPKTEVITTQEQDNETGEWEEYTRSFKDKLFNRVYQEYLISRQLIDEHVDTLKTEEEIKLFINLSLGRLKYILVSIEKNEDAKKYDFSGRPVRSLIKYLYDRYELFCPDRDAIVNDIFEKNSQPQIQQADPTKALPSVHRGLQMFRTSKQSIEGFALVLHSGLTSNRLIPIDTNVEVIRNAFNGSIQEAPLKIRWLDKGKNKRINKHTLFYLLNKMASEGVVMEDTDNKTFLQRVNFVFVDDKGEPLQHLKVSNATALSVSKDTTPTKQIIDALIAELKKLQ